MKVCAHCGELFEEGKLVCPHCGADEDMTYAETPYELAHEDPGMDEAAYQQLLAEEGLADEEPSGKRRGCALLAAAVAVPIWLFLL